MREADQSAAVAVSEAPPVRTLNDRWELTDRLGSGAMGEVWKGRHTVLGHEVAIKLMKREASRDQQLVARFVREARIAAQLRHRNVARVEDFGTTAEGRPFLVMELLRGSPLDALLDTHTKLDLATLSVVARHVGAACDVAHAAGIVHRDLKPANCFLVRDDDGTALVKVLDFGVAKVADGLLTTHHGLEPGQGFSLIGTPVYMSPEQASGDTTLDGRSDLWSLAVMLYEMVTGELPYAAETLPQLLFQIVTAEVKLPRTHDATLPEAVDGWARKAFAKERGERFQDGRTLAETLVLALGAPRVTVEPGVPVSSTRELQKVQTPLYASLDATMAVPNHSLPGSSGAYGGSLAGPLPFGQGSLAPQVVSMGPAPGVSVPMAMQSVAPVVPVAKSRWGGPLLLLAGVGIGVAVMLASRGAPSSPAPVTEVHAAVAPVVPVAAPMVQPPPMPVAPSPTPVAVNPARAAVTASSAVVPPARPVVAPRVVRTAPPVRTATLPSSPPPTAYAPPSHPGTYNPDEP